MNRPISARLRLGLLLMPAILGAACVSDKMEKALNTVSHVDLNRYVGTWYEIAKIPNRFQRNCARDTTADYSLREDGRINVINRCVEGSGQIDEARGIARVVDSQSNAKLKVSFVNFLGMHLFWGDYWIIALGEGYEYALVGTPSRKYGWILSRNPALGNDKLTEAFSRLRSSGYDPNAFEMTSQSSRQSQR
jgi:apolipoprotein D and lipocalin family protein